MPTVLPLLFLSSLIHAYCFSEVRVDLAEMVPTATMMGMVPTEMVRTVVSHRAPCLSVYLSVCLSVCLPDCLSVCMCVWVVAAGMYFPRVGTAGMYLPLLLGVRRVDASPASASPAAHAATAAPAARAAHRAPDVPAASAVPAAPDAFAALAADAEYAHMQYATYPCTYPCTYAMHSHIV